MTCPVCGKTYSTTHTEGRMWCSVGCQFGAGVSDDHAIDWRARCLAAESGKRIDDMLERRVAKANCIAADATSIARRALVDGLAEAERLRFELWMWKHEAHEQRDNAAAAAREERDRVVAWLRRDPTMWADTDLADAIERGDHTAHAPGKGGEG